MLNLSPTRLIDVWHELELCWDKKNGYGTDTAEIYVYTLCDGRPAAGHDEIIERECGEQAAINLYYVLKMFSSKRDCGIAINGKPFGDWLLEETLYHRCHVQIVEKT